MKAGKEERKEGNTGKEMEEGGEENEMKGNK
jgi:hypothetical protein